MAYIPPLNGGRLNASLSGNSTSAGAGYSLLSTGTLFLAGGNNITLSQNGASVTISGANAAGASINISASNASANLASVTFSNSNGLSFGLNAGVITASHNALTTQNNQAASATNGSFTFQTIGFSGGNGVTFGTSAGSIVSASVATSYAASNHSHGNPTLNLTNISGTTASASNGLTLSLSAAAPTGGVALSAAGASASNGTVTLSNSNGLAFGMAGSVITGSYTVPTQSNQTLGFSGLGNTTLTSTGNFDARSLVVSGMGNVSVGMSNGTMLISATGAGGGGGGGVALYDGVHSISSGTANLNASGALTVSITNQSLNMSVPAVSQLTNAGAITMASGGNNITIGAPVMSMGITGATAGGTTGGNTVAASNALYLAAGSNISLVQSTGVGAATVSIYGNAGGGGGGGGVALYDGVHSISSGTANLNASGALTVSITNQSLNMSVPDASSLVANSPVTLSTNGSTISIGANVGTVSNWEPNPVGPTFAARTVGNGSLYFFKLQPQAYISATQLQMLVNLSLSSSSNSSHAASLTFGAGIYNANGASLSLNTQSSGSYTFQYSNTSNNSYASLTGVKAITMPMNFVASPGNYWLGFWVKVNTANTSWVTPGYWGMSNVNSSFMGMLGGNTNQTQGIQEAVGVYSNVSASTLLPSATISAISSQHLLTFVTPPYMAFKNTTW